MIIVSPVGKKKTLCQCKPPFSIPCATAQVTTPAPKPKFVEGTVYQLARALYEIHTAYESLPASAIQDTMQRMSDNPDRKVLLIAGPAAKLTC